MESVFINTIRKFSWVIRFGTKYCREALIAVDADHQIKLPVFDIIKDIYVIPEYLILLNCFIQNSTLTPL